MGSCDGICLVVSDIRSPSYPALLEIRTACDTVHDGFTPLTHKATRGPCRTGVRELHSCHSPRTNPTGGSADRQSPRSLSHPLRMMTDTSLRTRCLAPA